MRKILFLVTLFISLAASAQTYTDVPGKWRYFFLKADSALKIPSDTIASAPVNSIAVKNGVMYVHGASWIPISGAGGSGVWGSITGLIGNQTDLVNLLGAKMDSSKRTMDTLYAITDSTFGYYIHGQFRTFKALGALKSFNGRNGAIILTLADVTTAIGYTPLAPSDTVGRWVRLITNNATNDSIIYYIGNTRFAIKDNGSGGGGSFDSASTQGGNFHTQPYNDVRYVARVDSSGAGGYASYGRLYKVRDSLNAAIAATLATKKDKSDSLTNLGSYSTLGRLYKTIDSVNAIISAALALKKNNSDSTGPTSYVPRNQVDSFKTTVDTSRTSTYQALASKMTNYGSAPGQVQFNFASIPAATGYPTGTTLIVPDSGFHYVDTGTGGSRGWKKIAGGSGGGLVGLSQIFAKAPLLVSGTDTTYADTSRSATSNSHLVTQNMVRNVHVLEYVDSLNTNTLQNNKLIGAKILQLQIGGITVPTIPTGGDYYTFNESLGQITLQNDSFYANNHIYVLYRAPYVDSLVSTPTIGVIAYMNSFGNINFFHNNSPGAAFSISGTQIVKRNLGAIGMWSFNGDAIDYPLLNTCDEQGYFEFTYRIGSQGSGLGSGIKFGPGNSDGGAGSFNSIYANLNIASLTTPKLYLWNQQVAKDSATFPSTIAVGDSIKMRMTRNKGKFVVKVTDLNTSATVSDSITFNYTYPGNFVIPQSGRWGIAGFGSGIDTIRSLTIGSNSIVNPKVIFIGDSKTTGLYAQSQTNRYGEQVGANPLYQPFAIYADPSDRTYDALGNIEYIIQYVRPKVAFLNIGRNDGMPFSTGSKANYMNIVSRLEGYGIRVIHVLPIPETSLNQSTLSSFITSTYGTANTVDPSVGFNTGTMLAADGVHPIGTGNTVVANNIIAAMKIIY